jgi:uncharacterized protein (UPF0333 family)
MVDRRISDNPKRDNQQKDKSTHNSSGQAAMEYLVLTGFMLLILSILLVAAYNKINQSEKHLDINAAERAVNELKRAADFVYVHGHPTKLSVSVYLPVDINPAESYIGNNTINIAMRSSSTYTDVWRRARGEVTGNWPSAEGYYVFEVSSTDYGDILISY